MSAAELPLVTVVIPARNEERHIEECLAHVAAQDYPLARIEVLVVDGASSDRTGELAEKALAGVPFARAEVITNPAGTTPSNLNRGLAEAAGEYLCRVDARSFIPTHYVRSCVDVLASRPDVAVVGGAQVAIAPRPDAVGVGIARALNNQYAMGFARYRRGAASGPSDTVYLGAFRTDQVREIRGWDERFETNQDFELNRRMRSQGQIWFAGELDVGYVPRTSLTSLWSQYARFGQWKVRYWTATGEAPRARQVLLLLAPMATATGVLATAARRRSLRPIVGAAVGGCLGLAAVEVRGAAAPRGGAAAHGVACAALLATTTGWLAGVATGCSAWLASALRVSRRAPR